MKTICLMRHAEAPNVIGKDFDRVLSNHGKNQATKAVEFLKDYNFDAIITSDAPRVLETSNPIEKLYPNAEIERHHLLYTGSCEDYIDIIEQALETYNNILLIGHNPTILSTALKISEKTQKSFNSIALEEMTPARIIVLKIKTEFSNPKILDKCIIENIFDPKSTKA